MFLPSMSIFSIKTAQSIVCQSDVANWVRNIDEHANASVNRVLVGNKCDMPDKRWVFTVFLFFGFKMLLFLILCVIVKLLIIIHISSNRCIYPHCVVAVSRVISTEKGKALAAKYGIKFFETVIIFFIFMHAEAIFFSTMQDAQTHKRASSTVT